MNNSNILSSLKILYVEDEPITRDYVSKYLKQQVGRVILAVDGNDGIKKFSEFDPDIIITDLVLPDMSGIEMMAKIRENKVKCPVIITSALCDSQTILKSIDLKIDKYLVKPIDLNILLKTLLSISVQLLEENHGVLVINEELIVSKENKDKLELDIRNIYSKYLKSVTGKGAKTIQVFIKGKVIEIVSKENLTLIEESLLNAGRHSKDVEIIRKVIYENTKLLIEQELEKLIDRKVVMDKVEIYPYEKYEKINFNIK
ncbi:Na-translocating system protein MpsC family protein [Clostridium sp. CTA-7]